MACELPVLLRMQCLWPSTKIAGCSALVAAAALFLPFAWCSGPSTAPVVPQGKSLTQAEKSLSRTSVHIAQFSPVSEPLALPTCGSVHPPEALVTPDPFLHGNDDSMEVRVSFIVGADGRVHSAFVMESGGPAVDQNVLRAVRLWRYRPALCNGVPTDAEASVRFRIR